MTGWPDRPRVLISYAYLRQDSVLPEGVDLLLDSGAFTAYTQGATVDLGAYIDFLAARQGQFTAAFALDVIGDHDATMRNFARMTQALPGVLILPTWHFGSAVSARAEVFAAAHEAGGNYAALGGMVPYAKQPKVLMRSCIPAHQEARALGISLHGLGVTGNEIRRLPWHSLDASTWSAPQRWASLCLANQRGRIYAMDRGRRVLDRAAEVRRFGLVPEEFASPCQLDQRHVRAALVAACRAYMYAEAVGTPALRIYLACTANQAATVRDAWAAGSPWPIP